MRLTHLFLAMLIFGTLFTACAEQETDYSKEVTLNTLEDSVSYALGFQAGNRMYSQGFSDVDINKYASGFLSGQENEDPQFAREEFRDLYTRFSEFLTDRMKVENAEEGKAFLAENKNKEGVAETPSGLQYKVVEEGSGASPTPSDTVVVNYEGTLIDGTVFDSSYDRGEPAKFVLGGVIDGWIEGLQLMQEGGTYMFYIPSELAYGENPRPGGAIQPNHTLIFKVELLEVR